MGRHRGTDAHRARTSHHLELTDRRSASIAEKSQGFRWSTYEQNMRVTKMAHCTGSIHAILSEDGKGPFLNEVLN